MNTQTQLLSFLGKYETYLNKCNTLLTPENYGYWRENGCFPPTTDEERLQKKLLLGGWNFKLLWSDFYAGKLSLETLNEFKDAGCLTEEDFRNQASFWKGELELWAFGSGGSYSEETTWEWLDFFEELGYLFQS